MALPSIPHRWRGVQCSISDLLSEVGGVLTKSQGRMLAAYWRETRNAPASILSKVRENIFVTLASYDSVSVTVLYQRLQTLLFLDPLTPEFMMKMRGVVANSGMRALGLAPMDEESDNTVTVCLLAPHWFGGGGMGEPVLKCVQDLVITILAGLQHSSVGVRDNYENLVAHAWDSTRDVFFSAR